MYSKESLFFIQEQKQKFKDKSIINEIPNLEVSTRVGRQHNLNKDDLYRCIRALLCFGRMIGIIPLTGLFRPNFTSVNFRYQSLGSIFSVVLITGMTANEVICLLAFLQAPARDVSETAKNFQAFVCYGIGLYVFIFMYAKSSKLMQCLKKWRDLKTMFYKEDSSLYRTELLISGIIYTSAILENMASHWKYFKSAFSVNNTVEPVSVWENYFVQSHPQYTRVISYNVVLAIGIFFCNKLAVYAWNFGDILIAVLSRGVYKRFELHLKNFKERINADNQRHNQFLWIQAVKDHENLVDLLKEFNKLLSPLIFTCIGTNIYFICLTLNSFLLPYNEDPVNIVYEAWAFIHLLVRTFTAILLCARVNTYAHKIEQTLATCPIAVLTKEVERTELRLRTSCIGFGGLGCFTITNSFALSVFSVIFTFEIVLLQSSPPNNMIVNNTNIRP